MNCTIFFYRKRCMDLVSFENQQEQNFVGQNMARAGVREVWTSGRLCDKERWWWDFLDQDQKCFGDQYLERQKPYLFSIYWYQIHLLNHIQNMSNVKKVPNIHFFGCCLPKMWPHLEIPPKKRIQFYSLKSHR